MIQEQYVSFETAKLLKDKGFNEPCICYSYGEGMNNYFSKPSIIDKANKDSGYILLPTQQMAMRWLREIHRIHIQAFCPLVDVDCDTEGIKYNVVISNLANMCLAFDTPLEDIEYNFYEEACEAAIKYCLVKLIK